MNCINSEMFLFLHNLLKQEITNKVIILKAEGDTAFCTGGDVSESF